MKRRILISILIVAVLILAGMKTVFYFNRVDYKSSQEYVIGVSQANMREAWRLALIDEIEDVAANTDSMQVITADATSSVEKQKQDVDKLLQYGVDLLIISPCDSDQLTDTVKAVYQQGIPVIVMDRAVKGFDYTLFIGPDNELVGKQGAECVAELLGGKGNIIELCAAGDSLQSRERGDGFEDALTKKYPDIHINRCNLQSDMRDAAYDYISSIKDELTSCDLIFSNMDEVALGAYEALKELGLEEKILIVGCDGFVGKNEGIDLVKQGKLAATIACPTGGKEAVQYAEDILQKKSGTPKQVILRSSTITAENADGYLEQVNRKCVDDGRVIRMGYSQVGRESNWRLANTESIEEAADKFNIDLTIEIADQSQEKQIESIRRFIKEKMDVIVVSPVVEDGWLEVLQEAKDAGIPVVISDRKINAGEDLINTYIGADFLEEGRRAMRWLQSNKVPVSDEEIRIFELQGNKGASPTEERHEGFVEILEERPGYQIVYSVNGDYTYESGKRAVEAYMEENNWDIQVIFAHNDDMALGAIEALEEHGLKPGEDVMIVSVDGTKEAFQAMVAGSLNCSVECNPLLGPPLMKAVRDMIAGKEMPLRIITEEKVYDQTNAKLEIRGRLY